MVVSIAMGALQTSITVTSYSCRFGFKAFSVLSGIAYVDVELALQSSCNTGFNENVSS